MSALERATQRAVTALVDAIELMDQPDNTYELTMTLGEHSKTVRYTVRREDGQMHVSIWSPVLGYQTRPIT